VAIQFSLQGFVDQMVLDMQMTDDQRKLQSEASKAVVGKFSEHVRNVIEYHTQAINALKASASDVNSNTKAISYHEKQLDYYMS
jgi:hypothetical protein